MILSEYKIGLKTYIFRVEVAHIVLQVYYINYYLDVKNLCGKFVNYLFAAIGSIFHQKYIRFGTKIFNFVLSRHIL